MGMRVIFLVYSHQVRWAFQRLYYIKLFNILSIQVYMQHFWKFNTDDVMLCASDAGWINGHTYALFGPLLKGGATCLVELPTCLLNEGILERIINHCECSHLYLPVTLIRMLRSRLEMNQRTQRYKQKGL